MSDLSEEVSRVSRRLETMSGGHYYAWLYFCDVCKQWSRDEFPTKYDAEEALGDHYLLGHVCETMEAVRELSEKLHRP